MPYASKFFDIENPESFGEDWTKETLAAVLSELETMGREDLIRLCQHPDIRLSLAMDDWERSAPVEDILARLLMDYYSTILIGAIDEIVR